LTRAGVLAELAIRGYVFDADDGPARGERQEGPGLISRTHVTVTDPSLVKELQDDARTMLRGDRSASDVDPADAAVVALSAAGHVPSVLSRRESRDYKDRVESLTGRVGAVAPGLRRAIQGTSTTMIAAQGGIGGG
jgi:hypothetical protein